MSTVVDLKNIDGKLVDLCGNKWEWRFNKNRKIDNSMGGGYSFLINPGDYLYTSENGNKLKNHNTKHFSIIIKIKIPPNQVGEQSDYQYICSITDTKELSTADSIIYIARDYHGPNKYLTTSRLSYFSQEDIGKNWMDRDIHTIVYQYNYPKCNLFFDGVLLNTKYADTSKFDDINGNIYIGNKIITIGKDLDKERTTSGPFIIYEFKINDNVVLDTSKNKNGNAMYSSLIFK